MKRAVTSTVVGLGIALVAGAGAPAHAEQLTGMQSNTSINAHQDQFSLQEVRATPGNNRCEVGELCLYSEPELHGALKDLYYCGFVDLGGLYFPGGGRWNDKVSSINDRQTGSVVSIFYGYNGTTHNFEQLFSITSPTVMRYLDPAVNDAIDAVRVC